jgi:HD-GYP domain-containing protein (c-di-GMP phosphodiesterase class II)
MEKTFDKFRQNWSLKQEMSVFGDYFKGAEWFVLPYFPCTKKRLRESPPAGVMELPEGKKSGHSQAISSMFKALKTSLKCKSAEIFEYGDRVYGLCYAVSSGSQNVAYIFAVGMKVRPEEDIRKIFAAFTDTVLSESRKEIELEEINKTIRPRAIALSTVHTVHRLMTSTLDLDELLPRIARLSLQVIRANRCSIKLVNRKRKVLLPKTTIDLRKKKTKLKKVEIGRYAPGRAVKKESPVRGRNYLASPMIDEEVVGVITLYDKLDGKEFTFFDEEIMKTLSEQAAIAIKNAQLFNEQADLTLSSIRCIAQLLQDRPHGTHRAEASFLKLIKIMGRKFKMNETEIKMLQYAAMLHDAGQISIPEKVLMKRGELTGHEYAIVKRHPVKGAEILSKFRPLKPIIPIIKYHHENFDGSGYPKGLKGNDIPLEARILAVVSCFEAMITDKPYRKALSISQAIKEVNKNSGLQFDPKVVEIFQEAVRRKDVRKLLEKELGRKKK